MKDDSHSATLGSQTVARQGLVTSGLRPTTAFPEGWGHLPGPVQEFLLSRLVANCTRRTLETYARNLERFTDSVSREPTAWTPLATQRYLTALRDRMKPITVHQHFRCLRTFFTWATKVGFLASDPMRGLTMKVPRTLPRVPEDWEVHKLLNACPATWEGVRNRTLVTLVADSALRISEALRLCVRDVNFSARTVTVREGKGQKDGVGYFGKGAGEQLRVWLFMRGSHAPEDLLFCTRSGKSLTQSHATHVLHRLSAKARLPRKIGPHALRHYAATSILRQTGDLELVRRILRHETLAMALRYAHLTGADVAAKFARASPLDHLQRNG